MASWGGVAGAGREPGSTSGVGGTADLRYLTASLSSQPWTTAEKNAFEAGYQQLGNKWSEISKSFVVSKNRNQVYAKAHQLGLVVKRGNPDSKSQLASGARMKINWHAGGEK